MVLFVPSSRKSALPDFLPTMVQKQGAATALLEKLVRDPYGRYCDESA